MRKKKIKKKLKDYLINNINTNNYQINILFISFIINIFYQN